MSRTPLIYKKKRMWPQILISLVLMVAAMALGCSYVVKVTVDSYDQETYAYESLVRGLSNTVEQTIAMKLDLLGSQAAYMNEFMGADAAIQRDKLEMLNAEGQFDALWLADADGKAITMAGDGSSISTETMTELLADCREAELVYGDSVANSIVLVKAIFDEENSLGGYLAGTIAGFDENARNQWKELLEESVLYLVNENDEVVLCENSLGDDYNIDFLAAENTNSGNIKDILDIWSSKADDEIEIQFDRNKKDAFFLDIDELAGDLRQLNKIYDSKNLIWFDEDVRIDEAASWRLMAGKRAVFSDEIISTMVKTIAIIISTVGFFILVLICLLVAQGMSTRRMTKAAFTDYVTESYNWLRFEKIAPVMLRKNKHDSYALVIFDIDNFKLINDIYGNVHGDAVLKLISDNIRKILGKKELFSRYIGDEFVVILKVEDQSNKKNDRLSKRKHNAINAQKQQISNEQAGYAPEQQMTEVPSGYVPEQQTGLMTEPQTDGIERCLIGNQQVIRDRIYTLNSNILTSCDISNIHLSYGVYMVGCSENDIDRMVLYAGMAKDTVKKNREQFIGFFDEKIRQNLLRERELEDAAPIAFQNREFHVYLQPKYDPASGGIGGAEALVRWISPTLGFISPGDFIPLFEKNFMIIQLDNYMIDAVCRHQRKWMDEGRQLVTISVNLSRSHLCVPTVVTDIQAIVDSYGLPHSCIEIELTESAFFDDKQVILNTVNMLRSLGFFVSLDDFGSGYSSLNSLKDLPLDVIKLDGEFFKKTMNAERSETVILDTIAMAKHLNMRIVAEGIETKEQVEFLQNVGCDMIQGFYFSKPVPVEEFEEKVYGGQV